MRLLQLSIALLYSITFLFKTHICLNPEDKKTFVDGHNVARAQIGVGPISWDDKLEANAQDFANKVKSDCVDTKVSTMGPYGKNVAVGYGASTSWEAMGRWTGEKNKYDHTSNSCVKGEECTHYTQVVWRNSVRLGCGFVTCGAGWPFFVCLYDPPGNIPGQKPN